MENSLNGRRRVYCGSGIKQSDTHLKVLIIVDQLTNYIYYDRNGTKLVNVDVYIGEIDEHIMDVKLVVEQSYEK